MTTLHIHSPRGVRDAVTMGFLAYADCPCGSRKPYTQCHGHAGEFPQSDFRFCYPIGPPTGFAVEGCYMSMIGDCEGGLSREHYISQAILVQFEVLRTLGFRGKLDQLENVPTAALTARVLCERHNSMLGQLDGPAARAFERVADAQSHLLEVQPNRKKERHFLIDGYALELWALKTMLAMHTGGVLTHNGRLTRDALRFDSGAAVQNFIKGRVDRPLGFYQVSEGRRRGAGVAVQPLSKLGTLVGVRLQLVQLAFDCIFDPRGLDPERRGYRPSVSVYWNKRGLRSVLHVAWDGVKRGDDVYREELE